jgi:hypothetical protein
VTGHMPPAGVCNPSFHLLQSPLVAQLGAALRTAMASGPRTPRGLARPWHHHALSRTPRGLARPWHDHALSRTPRGLASRPPGSQPVDPTQHANSGRAGKHLQMKSTTADPPGSRRGATSTERAVVRGRGPAHATGSTRTSPGLAAYPTRSSSRPTVASTFRQSPPCRYRNLKNISEDRSVQCCRLDLSITGPSRPLASPSRATPARRDDARAGGAGLPPPPRCSPSGEAIGVYLP